MTHAGIVNKILFDMDIEVDPTLKPWEIAENDGPQFHGLQLKHQVDVIIGLDG